MAFVEEVMTIGDFARQTGLSISALRFYAGRGLLVPADIDSASGYRLYSEAQVADGRLIRALRRLDMSLAEIERALSLSDPERKGLVDRHLRRLEQVLRRAHSVAHAMDVGPSMEGPVHATTLEAFDFAQAINQVLPAAGTDPELPHLMGVLIEGKDGSVRIVATDSHRLAIRDLVPSSLEHGFSVVVPAASVGQWGEPLLSSALATLRLDGRNLIVVGEGADLVAPVVPITFPDYERFLESAAQVASALVNRAQLVTCLESFEGEDAVLATTTQDALSLVRGGQSLEIEAVCEGPDQHFAINPVFAADAARNAVGAEILIEIEDPVRAIAFRSADNGTYTSLVMPVSFYALDSHVSDRN